MTKNKIRVGLLFGGKSTEHEISLRSATNIYKAIDPNKYEVTLIGIDKKGNWHISTGKSLEGESQRLSVEDVDVPNILMTSIDDQPTLVSYSDASFRKEVDVVFPVLHGSYGEDGTMQGYLQLMNVPFVGPNALGSSVAMDKDVAKRLLRDAGIPIADFFLLYKWEKKRPTYEEVIERLGTPIFVKPVNAGSSVGVSKVKTKADFDAKIDHAFEFDNKVLIEEAIVGKELEVAVLGNEFPKASDVGEIVPQAEFYSYDAKYLSDDGALIHLEADVPEEVKSKVKALSIETFRVLELEGLSRIDFLYGENGKLAINEVNTLPGFTSISMYPQLWEQQGMSQTELVDELLQLAISRHERNNALKTSIES